MVLHRQAMSVLQILSNKSIATLVTMSIGRLRKKNVLSSNLLVSHVRQLTIKAVKQTIARTIKIAAAHSQQLVARVTTKTLAQALKQRAQLAIVIIVIKITIIAKATMKAPKSLQRVLLQITFR